MCAYFMDHTIKLLIYAITVRTINMTLNNQIPCKHNITKVGVNLHDQAIWLLNFYCADRVFEEEKNPDFVLLRGLDQLYKYTA